MYQHDAQCSHYTWLAQNFKVGKVLHMLLGLFCHAPALSLLTPVCNTGKGTKHMLPFLIRCAFALAYYF